ncbi:MULTISPECIES: maltokinase N-terminal cap-like domain-containing protein [unclassified Aeromicrobium]|uniref:maltokinase N-terminal cap-like domain-containing protein n=1 Tax=unclassified Aeromicrobium TaxID=2633570 RepID=UPI00396B2E51
MGVVHPGSELNPTKAELLEAWLPSRDWWPQGAEVPAFQANFRFDDPEGEVGIESFLLPVRDEIVHVPLTYRAAPIDGPELVGEMDHSALGRRWVYDGATDPVYLAEAAAVIREGRGEVTMLTPEGEPIPRRRFTAAVHGSGSGHGELHVARVVDAHAPAEASGILTATWAEHPGPAVLAWLA